MLELFKSPNEFFRNKINEKEDMRKPFFIMFILWIARLFMVSTLLILIAKNFALNSDMDFPPISSDMYIFFSFLLVLVLFVTFIGILFMWLIVAGVFYVFSALFRGTGSFKRVLEFTSYGFIPYIVDTITSPVFFWPIIQKIDMAYMFEILDQTGDPSIFMNEMLYANMPVNVLSTLFSILLFVFSIYIWIYGLKYARGLSLKKAILTVGIPAVFYVIYELLMFVFYYV